MNHQAQLVNIIYTGNPEGQYLDPIPENALTQTIKLLTKLATEEPAFYLQTLNSTEYQITPMTMIAVGVLFAFSPPSFLSNAADEIYSIIKIYDPRQLYELTHLIKTKTFGKGLGSREQKAIRRVMEAWSSDDLKAFMISQGKYLFNLVRVIHPRYKNIRAEVLGSLIKKSPNYSLLN